MTIRENYVKAIFHQNPEWVSAMDEAVLRVRPPVCERPFQPGKDIFG